MPGRHRLPVLREHRPHDGQQLAHPGQVEVADRPVRTVADDAVVPHHRTAYAARSAEYGYAVKSFASRTISALVAVGSAR